MSSGKTYFASDFHLGIPNKVSSLEREKLIVAWLDEIKADAAEIFLVGDIFDFWFEYKRAIPKGFSRLLGKLAELTDSGIPISIFTGNHDMWMFGYFTDELNIPVIRKPLKKIINGKTFLIAHGDGLGPGDKGYKFIKSIFRNRAAQWLFARLHPNFGIGLANYFSKRSRMAESGILPFLGEDKEWMVQYCKSVLKAEHIDFFVFGHRHIPLDISLHSELGNGSKARFINLGDWLQHNTYAVFDGEQMEIRTYSK